MQRTACDRLHFSVVLGVALAFGAGAAAAQAESAQAVEPIDSPAPAEVIAPVAAPQDSSVGEPTSDAVVVAPSGIAVGLPEQPLDEDLESVKKALLALKRDLVILEEDLLFPASSQMSVFLSMDVGEFFQLDAVSLKVNGKEVTHHLYTEKQVDALYRGGVQKLYIGNVKQGGNRVTAFFTGRGPNGRDYKRATTVEFEKGFEPAFVELAIADSTAKYQPEFKSAVRN